MQHVEADRIFAFQHPFQAVEQGLGRHGFVQLAIGVVPAAPKFRAEIGAVRPRFGAQGEFLFGDRLGAEIDAADHAGHRTLCVELGRIGGIEQSVEAGVAQGLLLRQQIGLVAAEGAVFVLDLRQHDRPAAVDLQRRQFLAQPLQPALHWLEIARIERARGDVRRREQPGGQAAAVPFGADIGPGTQIDQKAFFLGQADIGGDVEIAREIVVAGRGFVRVPEDVGGQGVQTQRLQLLQAVAPRGARDARIVHLAGQELERLAVQNELVVRHPEARRGGQGRDNGAQGADSGQAQASGQKGASCGHGVSPACVIRLCGSVDLYDNKPPVVKRLQIEWPARYGVDLMSCLPGYAGEGDRP